MFTKSSFGHGPGAHPYHIHYGGAQQHRYNPPRSSRYDTASLKHTRTHTPPPRGRRKKRRHKFLSRSPSAHSITPPLSRTESRPSALSLSLSARLSSNRPLHKESPSVRLSHTRVFSYKLREVFVHVVVVAVALQVLARDEVLNPLLDLLRVGLEVSAQRETQRERER